MKIVSCLTCKSLCSGASTSRKVMNIEKRERNEKQCPIYPLSSFWFRRTTMINVLRKNLCSRMLTLLKLQCSPYMVGFTGNILSAPSPVASPNHISSLIATLLQRKTPGSQNMSSLPNISTW